MFAPLTTPQQQWVTLGGTIGGFTAPGSEIEVVHISTLASLADTGTGSTRITRDLLPVREMFEVGDLNFDELLQRDLDDHRVAKDIIPYLLKNSPFVRFFPPILAVVVPIANKRVVDYYPAPRQTVRPHPQDPRFEEVTDTYGGCIELVRARQHGSFSGQAELKFNPDQAKLVIIDGQHRAMAMLAIRRQKSGDWGDKGRDYKHFYEELAADLKNPQLATQLDNIEMPVCICFFPSLVERDGVKPSHTTVQCCRRLFLDVNKNAKRPTKARQLLLDDSNLLSGITRSMLTLVREKAQASVAIGAEIELDAFEYDSPHDLPTPKRVLAICTVEMLRQLIYWVGFADASYYTKLNRKPQGRLADPDRGRFLKEILFDDRVPTTEWRTWGYDNFETQFDPKECNSAAQPRLAKLFNESWGAVILKTLSNLHPFQAHHRAVAQLKASHRDETGHGRLAWRALFDGQGVLWTLIDYAESRAELRRKHKELALPDIQIEQAYRAIHADWIPKEFVPKRAALYLLKKGTNPTITKEEYQSVTKSYETYLTQAFQIGVLMAFAYLKKQCKIKTEELGVASTQWVEAWNDVAQRTSGLHAFDRTPTSNGFMSCYPGTLTPQEWYWFRYFTFEMLAGYKKPFSGKVEAQEAAKVCRGDFIAHLARAITAQEARLGVKQDEAVSLEQATSRWRKVLMSTVGITAKEFDSWAKGWKNKVPTPKAVDSEENDSAASGSSFEAVDDMSSDSGED